MIDKPVDPLVEKVMRKRMTKGLSIRAVSDIVGVAFSSLARYERGEGKPDEQVRLRLERWLGADQGSLSVLESRKAEGWGTRVDRRLEELEKRMARVEGKA